MADCCTPGSGFPNAATMEQLATNFPVVWEEICLLQQAVLAASSQCQPGGGSMCTTVGGNTPMTFISGVLQVLVDGTTTTPPTYEQITATASQTVVNTIVSTLAASGGTSYLLVFVNGVMQIEGASFAYTVTGLNQITFSFPLALGDTLAIYSYSTGVTTGGGVGYFNDTPSVEFVPPIGSLATGATGTVVTNGGNILGITITAGGTGYQPVPATMSVTSVLGAGAVLEPLVNGAGNIVNINIASAGSGYVLGDTVTATRAVLPNIAYVNAVFQITTVGITGDILAVAILNPGSGYQPSVTEAKIVSTLNPLLPYPLGTGFIGTVLTDVFGAVTQVVVDNTGAGYAIYPPYLVITDPGTGAETVVTLSGSSVASILVTVPGSGYTPGAVGTVFNPPTALLPNPPAIQASVTIVTSVNTFGTNPHLYWQVWSGTATNKPIQLQLNSVIAYFKGLGYTITIQSNPDTGSTIQWKICW
jgi:hypothetical protein